jgi:tetratricopeptide (TPR) repeat protein
MELKNTRAWQTAEWRYSGLHADQMVPFLHSPPSKAEIVEQLRRIVRQCPQFYPAVLELGLHTLSMKRSKRAEQLIEKGFRLMLDLAEPEHLEEEIDGLVENLETLWQFDVIRRLLELAAPRYPGNTTLLDSLAHVAARVGDLQAAQGYIGEALRSEPRNASYWCNKGWYHLMAGELEEAGEALRTAREIKPRDKTLRGNLRVHAYLCKHGGTYFDFLLRPPDRVKIDRLTDEGRWNEADRLRAEYNDSRMEAFAKSMLLKSGSKRPPISDFLGTLRAFFDFVEKLDPGGFFLHEDLPFVHRHFKPIMHKFIFKFGDVDQEMIDDLYKALTAYYRFLSGRGLVSPEGFKQFRKTILELQGELINKMERYNAIRHDEAVDEDQKEAIREELFEGDHAWPHI